MPDRFQSASRRESWLPHQCHKTLYAKYSPHVKYLPINHRHNFSSNGCWKPSASRWFQNSGHLSWSFVGPPSSRDVSFLQAFVAVTFIFLLVLVFSPMTESIFHGHVPFLWVWVWGNNNLSLHISVVTTLSSTEMIIYGINEWGKMFRSIPNYSSSHQPRV